VYAEYAAGLDYEGLPAEVVGLLKRIVLDTLGTTLAASTLDEASQPLVRVARAMGGQPESTVLGFGDRLPAPWAALVNGGMAQAMNYADTAADGGHLGPTTVPAALAAAERVGGVSGRDFLAALAAGAELHARVAAAARVAWGEWPVKPLRTQLWGYFSGAVCAGRVLGLDAARMHSALGLALMQASGTMQIVWGGDPPAKAIYAAFPNHGGVLSALLAEEGLGAGCAGVFEGEAGLFALYHEGRYQASLLYGGLGERWHLLGTRFKPWPVSGVTHALLEAALGLAERERLPAAAIAGVHLRGGPDIAFCCEPAAVRKRPPTTAAAANSVYYGVAKALVNGRVGLADFTPEGLRQEAPLALADRMTYAIEGDLGTAGIVEVTTTDGARHAQRVDVALGHSTRPLDYARLAEKFVDCAQYAARPVPRAALDEAIALVARLEEVPDVGVLAGLVSAGSSGVGPGSTEY
jgi:2-methylcitrate dehydratase PrpD